MVNKPRDYKKEAAWENSPEQVKRRVARNRARRKLGLKKGDPREAAHVNAPRKGSLDGVKVVKQSRHKNRIDQPKRKGRGQVSGHA